MALPANPPTSVSGLVKILPLAGPVAEGSLIGLTVGDSNLRSVKTDAFKTTSNATENGSTAPELANFPRVSSCVRCLAISSVDFGPGLALICFAVRGSLAHASPPARGPADEAGRLL